MLMGCAHHHIPTWSCRPQGRGMEPGRTVPRARGVAWLPRPAAEPGRMASPERPGTSPGGLSVHGPWPATQVCVLRKCVNSPDTPSPRPQAPRPCRGQASLWSHTSARSHPRVLLLSIKLSPSKELSSATQAPLAANATVPTIALPRGHQAASPPPTPLGTCHHWLRAPTPSLPSSSRGECLSEACPSRRVILLMPLLPHLL